MSAPTSWGRFFYSLLKDKKVCFRINSMTKKDKSIFDRLAIWISAICIVHCLTVPIIIAFLPIASFGLGSEEHFHEIIFWLVFPITTIGLVLGIREHSRFYPMCLGIVGLAILSYIYYQHGDIAFAIDFFGSVIASLLLAYAHWTNLQLVSKYHVHGEIESHVCCDHKHD